MASVVAFHYIDCLQLTSSPPCWVTLNKITLINFIYCSGPPTWPPMSLSFRSLGIGCDLPICSEAYTMYRKLCLKVQYSHYWSTQFSSFTRQLPRSREPGVILTLVYTRCQCYVHRRHLSTIFRHAIFRHVMKDRLTVKFAVFPVISGRNDK